MFKLRKVRNKDIWVDSAKNLWSLRSGKFGYWDIYKNGKDTGYVDYRKNQAIKLLKEYAHQYYVNNKTETKT
jgi:hypothetical protein